MYSLKYKKATQNELTAGILGHLEGIVCNKKEFFKDRAIWEHIIKNPLVAEHLKTKSLFGGFESHEADLTSDAIAVSCTNIKLIKNKCKVKLDILNTYSGKVLDTCCRKGIDCLYIAPVGEGEINERSEIIPGSYVLQRFDVYIDKGE